MFPPSLHIAFAGGGTGGHLFPGLAVAHAVSESLPGARLTFVGSGKPLERQHVAAAGFDYLALPCHALPGRLGQLPAFLAQNLAGYLAARRFLREEKVRAVVGLGGYASVPVGRAARASGAKLLLLEQNVLPGRATRWLARGADAVCLAMEAAATRVRCPGRIEVTGTPIRPGFVSAAQTPRSGPQRLLVLGGSAGAESLNQNVPKALYRTGSELIGWEIIHQSGESNVETTRALYAKLGLRAVVTPFVRNMAGVLGQTDVVVCRAGGSTLAELAAVGVPAVLLPYPHAKDDHQRLNAEWFQASTGCPWVDTGQRRTRLDESLADVLVELMRDERRRRRIALVMRQGSRPNAAQDVCKILAQLLDAANHTMPAAA